MVWYSGMALEGGTLNSLKRTQKVAHLIPMMILWHWPVSMAMV